MSKVSVIVPIYNAEKYLSKCIKSILNQTLEDIELILVNDGSTDNSLNVCNMYAKQDNRIKVIDSVNRGCIHARRLGVESATSPFSMFVDSDDWIDTNMVDVLYKESICSESDITVCNTYKFIGDTAIIKKKVVSEQFNDKVYEGEEVKKIATTYFHGHQFSASLFGKLYKTELLVGSGKYLDRIKFLGEDLYYNLEMLLKSNKVKVIGQPLYYYRAGGNTSRFMPYLFDDMTNGYLIQKDVIKEHFDNSKQHTNGISVMLLNTFKTCLQNLFQGNLSASERKNLILEYVSNEHIIECLSNEGSKKCFSNEFLEAIKNKDIEYFYLIGQSMNKKRKLKSYFTDILSKIS